MAFTPVRKKLLTRHVLKLIEDQPRYVKIESPMYLGKDLEKDVPEDKKKNKGPATILDVINLEDGEQVQLMVLAIVKSVLDDNYPSNSYVGKCFAVTKRGRVPGKLYNPVDVEEIEDPNPPPVVTEPAPVVVAPTPVVTEPVTEPVPVSASPVNESAEVPPPKKNEAPNKSRLFGR